MKNKIIKVNVTVDDIKNGKPRCVEKCPVALAIKRLNYEYAQVCSTYIYIYPIRNGLECYKFDMPEVAQKFIQEFDRDMLEYNEKNPYIIPSPFEFEIKLIEH